MQKLIEQKLQELKANFPENPEFRSWLSKSDIWGWIHGSFRIEGRPVDRSAAVDLVEGRIREEMPLSSYAFVQNYQSVYADMKACIYMQTSLTPELICRWAKMLQGLSEDTPDEDLYRKNRAIVYEWELIPVEEDKVRSGVKSLVKQYNRSLENPDMDPLERASIFHLQLLKLYPFGEETLTAALAVLMFSLLQQELPIPELTVDDRAYNTLVADFVDSGSAEPFTRMLERSVYNRLETVVSLAKQAKENE